MCRDMSHLLHHAVSIVLHGWNRQLRWFSVAGLLVVGFIVALILRDFVQPPTPGVSNNEILIGSSLPLSGSIAQVGVNYAEGVRTAFEIVNRKGGVYGRQLRLITRDDGYEPLQCVLNTRDLISKDRVFALTSYVGTGTSVKAQTIWTGEQVPVVGFFTGARGLREPFNRYNFHVRSSYQDEALALVNLLTDKIHVKRVAIFYQYDAFGQTVLREVRRVLLQHQISVVAEGSYPRNSTDIASGLKRILDARPECVFMIATYGAGARFVRELKLNSKQPVIVGALSFVAAENFIELAGRDANDSYVTLSIPHWTNTKVALVRDYYRDSALIYPNGKLNSISLEGYINGRVIVEGLKRSGRSPTREKFIDALESIHGPVLGEGFDFEYSHTNHEGSHRIYQMQIKEGRLESLDRKN